MDSFSLFLIIWFSLVTALTIGCFKLAKHVNNRLEGKEPYYDTVSNMDDTD